jgi:hypothetical protein
MYSVTQSQIYLASTVMAPVGGRERTIGNTVSGVWENYEVRGGHMHITSLLLNDLMRLIIFLCKFCWWDENSRCLDTG